METSQNKLVLSNYSNIYIITQSTESGITEINIKLVWVVFSKGIHKQL